MAEPAKIDIRRHADVESAAQSRVNHHQLRQPIAPASPQVSNYGVAYAVVFRSSNDSFLGLGLTIVVGLLSTSLFAITRRSRRAVAMFRTGSWFETALTAWMMMLFALFIVFSTLALFRRLFVSPPA